MSKNDLRYRRTHSSIEAGFLSLLEEKDLSSITIDQIVARASCNRNTFYLHFRDKGDLLEQLNAKAMEQVSRGLRIPLPLGDGAADGAILQYLRSILECFEENRRVFQLLSKHDPAFHLRVRDAIRDGIIASSRVRGIRRGQETALEVYTQYIAAGITSAAFSWLDSSPPVDKETLVRLLGDIDIPSSEVVVRNVLVGTGAGRA